MIKSELIALEAGSTVYVCGPKKFLNRTLAIDSTFAVGLPVEFID